VVEPVLHHTAEHLGSWTEAQAVEALAAVVRASCCGPAASRVVQRCFALHARSCAQPGSPMSELARQLTG